MARKIIATGDNVATAGVYAFGTSVVPPLSFSLWFYATGTPQSYASLFEIYYLGLHYNVFVGLSGTGPHLSYYFDNGTKLADPGNNSINNNAWNNVIVVINSSNSISAYLNGASESSSATFTYETQSCFLYVGKPPDQSSTNGFSFADMAMWNVALTAGEIAAIQNGARPGNIRPGTLLGWWPLDGLQSPEPDLSGFANNGTLTGTALASGPPLAMFTPRWPQFNAAAAAAVTFPPGTAMAWI